MHQLPAPLLSLFWNTGLLYEKEVFQVRFWAWRVQEDFAEHMAIFLDEFKSLFPSF